VVLFALGNQDQRYGQFQLPFDLSGIGAPGCFLRINLILFEAVAAVGLGSGGGVAAFTWPLPADPALRGSNLFFQAFAVDANANALGLTSSNALQAVVQ
jgi:hypothetical protein